MGNRLPMRVINVQCELAQKDKEKETTPDRGTPSQRERYLSPLPFHPHADEQHVTPMWSDNLEELAECLFLTIV